MGSVKSTHKDAVKYDKAQKQINKFMRDKTKKSILVEIPEGRLLFIRNLNDPKTVYKAWV